MGHIDWDYERERAVRALLQLLQLHLHRLWDPPVAEEEFVKCVYDVIGCRLWWCHERVWLTLMCIIFIETHNTDATMFTMDI